MRLSARRVLLAGPPISLLPYSPVVDMDFVRQKYYGGTADQLLTHAGFPLNISGQGLPIPATNLISLNGAALVAARAGNTSLLIELSSTSMGTNPHMIQGGGGVLYASLTTTAASLSTDNEVSLVQSSNGYAYTGLVKRFGAAWKATEGYVGVTGDTNDLTMTLGSISSATFYIGNRAGADRSFYPGFFRRLTMWSPSLTFAQLEGLIG